MVPSGTRKLLLVLMVTAFVFSGSAEAWSWSWGSDQSGSNGGWGWSSGNSGGGSSWGWGWSSNGTDTNWGWGSSSGSHHSSGTGSIHNSHKPGLNHSTHNSHSSSSNHSSNTGSTHNHTAPTSQRRKIMVTVWKNGFNYTEWVSKHAPFYVNDVLVFKYNTNQTQSSKTKNFKNNNVYLLPDLRSYKRCDVTRGKKLVARRGGDSSSSSGGFKLLLRKTIQTYYFVSGDHNGCNHNMKFTISPLPHPSSH